LSIARQEQNQLMRPQFRCKLLLPQSSAQFWQIADVSKQPLVAHPTAAQVWPQPCAVRQKLPQVEAVAGHFFEYYFFFPCA
jgi:hypothetical protein